MCSRVPGIDLWFKTTQRDGLLLLAASEGGQEEIVLLQLRTARPWLVFDTQGGLKAYTVKCQLESVVDM